MDSSNPNLIPAAHREDRFIGVPCSTLDFTEQDWKEFVAPFVTALAGRYPEHAAHIEKRASEDSGPKLEDFDVYGERVDTGLRVRGQTIWRYLSNDKHVCMILPGGHHSFTWAPLDAES